MSDPVFKISRTLDAPLSLVWEVYSQKEHLAKWWGPRGFEWVSGRLDFRPGGIFHYGVKAPTGHMMWGKFNYRENRADGRRSCSRTPSPTKPA